MILVNLKWVVRGGRIAGSRLKVWPKWERNKEQCIHGQVHENGIIRQFHVNGAKTVRITGTEYQTIGEFDRQ